MNRSLIGIGFDRNFPTILLLYNILKHMCLTTCYDDYNPTLNAVKVMFSKLIMFHEHIKLLPSGYSYDLSLGNETTRRM